MKNPSEIVDEILGRLSLVDESTYFSEVPWNRGINIRLFIHVGGENHRKFIESAKTTLALVRKNEMALFSQGVKHLTEMGTISESEDYAESFLYSAAETSIEINSNGEGQLVYLVMMLGSLIVGFSHDANFQNAWAMTG